MPSKAKPIGWINERRLVSDLTPAEYNPRQMTQKVANDLRKSIEHYGLVDPIVLNTDGTIISGHQRIMILAYDGVRECDVRVPDRKLTKGPRGEERQLNILMNKIKGDFDLDKLMEFDKELLLDSGFDEKEFQKILNPMAGLGTGAGGGNGGDGKAAKHPKICPECGYNLEGADET